MLTTNQKDAFRISVAALDVDGEAERVEPWMLIDDVAETAETVEDFRARWGAPRQARSAGHTVFCWDNVQTRRGATRGDLRVVDFGDARAVHFSGEA